MTTPFEIPTPEAEADWKPVFFIAAFGLGLVVGAVLIARRMPVAGMLAIGNAVAGLVFLHRRLARRGEGRSVF